MTTPTFDPEDAFWKQIEAEPGNSLPRLIYADWCDENDKPQMATLQRWLAATGRWPLLLDGRWVWLSHGSRDVATLPSHANHSLPYNLFLEIRGEESCIHADGWEFFSFSCRRASEEALAEAWRRATRWRQLFHRFRPRFDPVPTNGISNELPHFRGRMVELPRYQGPTTMLFNLLPFGLGFGLIWGAVTGHLDVVLKVTGVIVGFFAICVIYFLWRTRG